jgi:catechol 2,3-dioxygenase-like lactoylglutathione lyase family enzyme
MPAATDLPPSIMSHVSVGTNDYPRAKAFYDAVLATLQIGVVMEHPGIAVAYGRAFPEFWVGLPHDGGKAAVGNGSHFGFLATSRAQVEAFHAKALQMGGVCDGPPGLRPLYGPQYYGAFVRDLDGNKIEATFWDESASASSS